MRALNLQEHELSSLFNKTTLCSKETKQPFEPTLTVRAELENWVSVHLNIGSRFHNLVRRLPVEEV